jgi:hypothetical protein
MRQLMSKLGLKVRTTSVYEPPWLGPVFFVGIPMLAVASQIIPKFF